jgi:hypothetical protein
MRWWNNVLRVSSRWVNAVILCGYATETVSGRAWRDGWWVTVWVLDWFWGLLGEENHCWNSWVIDATHGDARTGQLDKEFRSY